MLDFPFLLRGSQFEMLLGELSEELGQRLKVGVGGGWGSDENNWSPKALGLVIVDVVYLCQVNSQVSKLAKKIKNNCSSALATHIYPLEGLSIQCPSSSEYYRPKAVQISPLVPSFSSQILALVGC